MLVCLARFARGIELPDASQRIAQFPLHGPMFSSKPVYNLIKCHHL
jgi:hypothetical protein